MNTYIKLIGIGVLKSIGLGAWAVFELTSMKTGMAALNEDVALHFNRMKRLSRF